MTDKHHPFSGYRVVLPIGALPQSLRTIVHIDPDLRKLVAGHRSLLVSEQQAASLYEAVEEALREHGTAVPLRFTPIRCNRARALPFEAVALSAIEVLYLVQAGFYGSLRCRDAAIAAVQACGALPAPTLGLAPLAHRASRAAAQQHVDTLIEREADVRRRAEVRHPRSST